MISSNNSKKPSLSASQIADINYTIDRLNRLKSNVNSIIAKLNSGKAAINETINLINSSFQYDDANFDDKNLEGSKNNLEQISNYLSGSVIPGINNEITRLRNKLLGA